MAPETSLFRGPGPMWGPWTVRASFSTYRFHHAPRDESGPFVAHLGSEASGPTRAPRLRGRESEVRYLADRLAISEIHAGFLRKRKSPSVAIVRDETERARTLFLGDGINDAPAMLTASVASPLAAATLRPGRRAIIVDASLARVDELPHISTRIAAHCPSRLATSASPSGYSFSRRVAPAPSDRGPEAAGVARRIQWRCPSDLAYADWSRSA